MQQHGTAQQSAHNRERGRTQNDTANTCRTGGHRGRGTWAASAGLAGALSPARTVPTPTSLK